MRREKLQQMLDISVVCGVKLDMKIVLYSVFRKSGNTPIK
jgi:hypothetical protein